jgi:glycosyltransferase involved in cell wall biosynthesis
VIPPFGIGSGGHNIIFQLVSRLEKLGHTCSLWVHDPFGERREEWPAVMKGVVNDHFAAVAAPLHKGFEHWRGADVVVATGWQTAHQTLLLDGARARAYLVNDHEVEFFPTSVESRWAADTYRMGMYGICGSPWLRDLYVERYGGAAGVFQYGVDGDVYHPRPIPREADTVLFYARTHTPRRAVPLGVLALQELRRRQPQLRVIAFGDKHPLYGTFPYEHTGVASADQLSWLFSAATVGLCLSLTNYSLVPQEMLACGLPCVDLRGASAESVFGVDGPVSLAAFDPVGLADELERLLTDPKLWRRRSEAGLEFVRDHSWGAAAEQVERELRTALALRERELSAAA